MFSSNSYFAVIFLISICLFLFLIVFVKRTPISYLMILQCLRSLSATIVLVYFLLLFSFKLTFLCWFVSFDLYI